MKIAIYALFVNVLLYVSTPDYIVSISDGNISHLFLRLLVDMGVFTSEENNDPHRKRLSSGHRISPSLRNTPHPFA